MANPQAAALGARLRAEVAQAKNALALEIAANLTEACPWATGHARANFVPGIEPYTGEDDSNGGAAAQGVAAVLGAGIDQPVYIGNNVPYLKYLIAGTSSQAAAGWDLEALDEAVQTVREEYNSLRIDVSDGVAVTGIVPRAVVVSGGDR